MEISEKVAYLKGLAEGLALDTESKEGKLIAAIIDVLDDMSEKFVDLEDELCDVEDGLDAVSDDLSDVEETLYFALDDDEDEDDESDEDEQQQERNNNNLAPEEQLADIDKSFRLPKMLLDLGKDRNVRRGSGKRSVTKTDLKQGRYVDATKMRYFL